MYSFPTETCFLLVRVDSFLFIYGRKKKVSGKYVKHPDSLFSNSTIINIKLCSSSYVVSSSVENHKKPQWPHPSYVDIDAAVSGRLGVSDMAVCGRR